MKRLKDVAVSRRGTTLVELVAAMALLSLLLLMISGVLHPAAAAVQRAGQMHDARRLLDDVLEVVRMEVESACGYAKLYEDGTNITEQGGTLGMGTALEYLNLNGEPVLVSAGGCGRAWLTQSQAEEIPPGRLFFLTRLRADADLTHPAEDDGLVLGTSCREPYGEAYYGGMYLKVQFVPVGEAAEGVAAEGVEITAALYRDAEWTELLLEESLVVELRNAPLWTTAITAVK